MMISKYTQTIVTGHTLSISEDLTKRSPNKIVELNRRLMHYRSHKRVLIEALLNDDISIVVNGITSLQTNVEEINGLIEELENIEFPNLANDDE